MQVKVSNDQPQELVRTLAKQLGVNPQNDCVEEVLRLPDSAGAGAITGFHFSGGLGLLVINCTLHEAWELCVQQKTPVLQFNFCLSGKMQHFLENEAIHYQLFPLQGSIAVNRAGQQEQLFLPAHTELVLANLMIDRKAYLKRLDCLVNEMPPPLADVFKDDKGKSSFLFQSNYSLAIADIIKRILKDKNEGMVRSTLVEGKVLELLSKQIKQFEDDLRLPEKQVILREQDIANIEAARDTLIANLQAPPTIEELARLTGINRQKLKSGFKLVFDKTINGYLRDYRLETAAMLLASGKSAVTTANEVGYVNQSHFARLFKEKYGVLPKDYLKTIHQRIKPE